MSYRSMLAPARHAQFGSQTRGISASIAQRDLDLGLEKMSLEARGRNLRPTVPRIPRTARPDDLRELLSVRMPIQTPFADWPPPF